MNELLVVVLAGLSIGVFGSFHCAGMCGPLALSLPINQFNERYKTGAVLLYNLGRAITYSIIGLVFGLLGTSFELFKMQQYLSIFAGVFILFLLFFSSSIFANWSPLTTYSLQVKKRLSAFLKNDKTIMSYLSIGILNGLLPCGLVYVAVAAAVASGGILHSGLLMFSFGIGTIPMMGFTMIFGKYMSGTLKNRLNKISPFLIGMVAILLILRGLNLGIPYMSPKEEGHRKTCCHAQ